MAKVDVGFDPNSSTAWVCEVQMAGRKVQMSDFFEMLGLKISCTFHGRK